MLIGGSCRCVLDLVSSLCRPIRGHCLQRIRRSHWAEAKTEAQRGRGPRVRIKTGCSEVTTPSLGEPPCLLWPPSPTHTAPLPTPEFSLLKKGSRTPWVLSLPQARGHRASWLWDQGCRADLGISSAAGFPRGDRWPSQAMGTGKDRPQ